MPAPVIIITTAASQNARDRESRINPTPKTAAENGMIFSSPAAFLRDAR